MNNRQRNKCHSHFRFEKRYRLYLDRLYPRFTQQLLSAKHFIPYPTEEELDALYIEDYNNMTKKQKYDDRKRRNRRYKAHMLWPEDFRHYRLITKDGESFIKNFNCPMSIHDIPKEALRTFGETD